MNFKIVASISLYLSFTPTGHSSESSLLDQDFLQDNDNIGNLDNPDADIAARIVEQGADSVTLEVTLNAPSDWHKAKTIGQAAWELTSLHYSDVVLSLEDSPKPHIKTVRAKQGDLNAIFRALEQAELSVYQNQDLIARSNLSPTWRYYRVYVDSLTAYGPARIQEIQFKDGGYYQSNQMINNRTGVVAGYRAKLSASNHSMKELAWQAFDGVESRGGWAAQPESFQKQAPHNQIKPVWVQVDFGDEGANVKGIAIRCAFDQGSSCDGIHVETSNDGKNWTRLPGAQFENIDATDLYLASFGS
ncbi:hypothetical protein [Pseudobacteriovorax antillogorgiicola]|uniref:F5/8 type C domain-containing protein n=1 Tax=Pseudobacteriovorax antillogorgiicola TaxID=1513793 RepID=A0A1Y6CQ19_9BACT|nr:hypothetical protein [Pseudobacteriovorax antillogorgiicola]TCS46382.1 hypothetical protein EDD56_12446 [Pseudobacteriovorax antillogorgiicola]SMF68639.1 hypothetical protein SAMN06296036_12446 [Pseudobacteriovorax antillogorgiicola]